MKFRSNRFYNRRGFLFFILFFTAVFLLCEATDTRGLSRKIVVFKSSFDMPDFQDALLRNSGATKIKSLKLINGSVVHMSDRSARLLKKEKEVLRVEDDFLIQTVPFKSGSKVKKIPNQPPQEIPWNMLMIGANLAWTQIEGGNVRVAVLDTGIDLDHPDLSGNIKGHINFIKPKKTGDDDNGHGTHVAGILAALDNAIGVIGVAPDIDLYAVKILDKQGRGWLSDLVDALDWCIQNEMQVINMSLGSLQDNLSMHEAIRQVNQWGITQVVAAGNFGLDEGIISYPARYPETIAVSSVDRFGNLDPYSSYGDEIDITAPGVDIRSAYLDGHYALMSGTSMSAPHVTGTVALLLCTTPDKPLDANKNGLWDPSEILVKLKLTAQSLGLPEQQQGAGLVRADEAIQ